MPAVGFDLDMTLVDTRPGIHDALVAFARETGRPIDAEAIVAALGPPVATALSPWFAPAELPAAVTRFREHMARVGVTNVAPLAGALDAVDAVRSAGFAVLVITAKIGPLAAATLAHAGVPYDALVGDVWSEGKAAPLRTHAAVAYVGDHPADMLAAVSAGIPGVGVTSGAATGEDLRAAGASTVIATLDGFRPWFEAHHVDVDVTR